MSLKKRLRPTSLCNGRGHGRNKASHRSRGFGSPTPPRAWIGSGTRSCTLLHCDASTRTFQFLSSSMLPIPRTQTGILLEPSKQPKGKDQKHWPRLPTTRRVSMTPPSDTIRMTKSSWLYMNVLCIGDITSKGLRPWSAPFPSTTICDAS